MRRVVLLLWCDVYPIGTAAVLIAALARMIRPSDPRRRGSLSAHARGDLCSSRR
jgi:hypothetical protein